MRIFDSVFRYLALVGAGSFAVATCITVADVVLHQFASGVLGAVDYVQLFIMSGAFLAMPYAFRVNAHVTLDLVWALLSPRGQWLLAIIALFLTLAFCALLAFYTSVSAADMLESSDISMNIGLPMGLYWVPFALGMVASTFAVGFNIVDALSARDTGPVGVA